ncbi:hypothetical protein N9X20_05325 [Opitutales bacterium]|nr:hypothetical protein [Opitutales bacterium]
MLIKETRVPAIVLSTIVCTLFLFYYLFFIEGTNIELSTVFLFLSGSLIFSDGVRWLRGELEALEPAGILGCLGLFYFYISPLLQQNWGYWANLTDLSGSRVWLDLWSGCSFIGIILYKAMVSLLENSKGSSGTSYVWRFHPQRFVFTMALFLCVSILAQSYVYYKFGGMSGFIETYTQRQAEQLGMSTKDPFKGYGVVMLVAESFKPLFALCTIYYFKEFKFTKSTAFLLAYLSTCFIVFLVFGGLRGSRSNTLVSLFIAAGMYHLVVRQISMRMMVLFGFVALMFLFGYSAYKVGGISKMSTFLNGGLETASSSETNRMIKYLVARDLCRQDVQTLAFREFAGGELSHIWGRSYIYGIFSVVPAALVGTKPVQLTKEKTEMIHGKGAFVEGGPRQTTVTLGQPGEAFVNFGFLGYFGFFAVFGAFVGRIRSVFSTLSQQDVRRYYLPMISYLLILMFFTDMNVIYMHGAKYLLFPAALLMFCLQVCKNEEALTT